MPKLRNGVTDTDKLAQWFGRKCRNHNPLEEVGAVDANTRKDRYKTKTKGDLGVLKDEPSTVIYHAAGRAFQIKIEEVPADKYQPEDLVAVGY